MHKNITNNYWKPAAVSCRSSWAGKMRNRGGLGKVWLTGSVRSRCMACVGQVARGPWGTPAAPHTPQRCPSFSAQCAQFASITVSTVMHLVCEAGITTITFPADDTSKHWHWGIMAKFDNLLWSLIQCVLLPGNIICFIRLWPKWVQKYKFVRYFHRSKDCSIDKDRFLKSLSPFKLSVEQFKLPVFSVCLFCDTRNWKASRL